MSRFLQNAGNLELVQQLPLSHQFCLQYLEGIDAQASVCNFIMRNGNLLDHSIILP